MPPVTFWDCRYPYRQPMYLTCLDLGVSGALFTTGWDRQVRKQGEEAKQLKQLINGQWIYLPKGGRDAILAAAHIDARPWDGSPLGL